MSDPVARANRVAAVYPAADLIQAFLNAYTICAPHQIRIENIFQSDRRESENVALTADFHGILVRPQRETDIRAILESASGDDTALVRATAFLITSAARITKQYGDQLIALDREGPLPSAPSPTGNSPDARALVPAAAASAPSPRTRRSRPQSQYFPLPHNTFSSTPLHPAAAEV